MRWLLLLGLVGCVLPKTTDTTRPLERTAKRPACSPAGGLKVAVTTSHATVRVVATRSRRCTLDVWQRYAHHQSTHAEVVGPDTSGGVPTDPGLVLAVLALDAPFFVLSAAFTGVALAVSPSQDDQYVKKVGTMAIEAPVAAAFVDVDAVMPSGAEVHGATDAQGVLVVNVPETEPASGVVVVHVRTLTGRVSYRRE